MKNCKLRNVKGKWREFNADLETVRFFIDGLTLVERQEIEYSIHEFYVCKSYHVCVWRDANTGALENLFVIMVE